MLRLGLSFTVVCLSSISSAAEPQGLLAEWMLDEGAGDVAHDSSGNGRDAKVYGASWVRQGDGFALSLDGPDAYVECGENQALGVTGPVTVEAWIKPMGEPRSDAHLLGVGMSGYAMTHYRDRLCWYVGHGKPPNWLGVKLTSGQWSHVAATFGDQRMSVWVNGQEVASRKTEVKTYPLDGSFHMSSKARPGIAKFRGVLDNVRVYNRVLAREEILARLKTEGAAHGIEVYATEDAALEAATRFFKTHPNEIDLTEQGDSILFANRRIGLAFQRAGGSIQLTRLYGIAEEQDYLSGGVVVGFRDIFNVVMTLDPKWSRRDERGGTEGSTMGVIDEMAGESFPVGSQRCRSVSWRKKGTATESVLEFEWKGIDVREDKGVVDVSVTVTLRGGDPLSYWRINVRNRGSRYGIERVNFPNLNLRPIGEADETMFLYPQNRGCLVRNPLENATRFHRYYPHNLNMQFQALYNRQSGKGIYLGTRDPMPSLMSLQIASTRSEIAWRLSHFPPNITFAEEDFTLPYDCVAGPFQGDWFDARQIYREWAVEQSWCRKGPLTTRRDIPEWYKEAPLYFYSFQTSVAVSRDSAEGARSPSLDASIPLAADHLREFLKWTGMRLPINWYGWKNYTPGLTTYDVPFNRYRVRNQGRWAGLPCENAHDGNYPKIGAWPNFSAECKRLRQDGGMVCPYVALEIFNQGPTENSPYAAEARPHIARDLFGNMRTWGVETSWNPCGWTQWWRNRMRETCVLLMERENVGGFYLDVMQGSCLPCYWTPHGHSAAGGNSMTEAMHGLTEYVFDAVKAKDPEAIITGENSAENMIDVIDGILIRTLAPENTAPILAAVYQDYIKRYGLEITVGKGDAFFIECGSLFVEGMQIGRLRLRPRDNTLSFQKPEHKEMIDFLGRVVGYYKQGTAKKFLVYGRLMRPLEFREPSPMPMLSYTSPYCSGEGQFPALMSGAFRSEDGELGIFVVNASRQDLDFRADVDLTRHGIPKGAIVDVDTFAPDGTSRQVLSTAKGIVPLKGSLRGHYMTMFQVKPAAEGI